jgi:hypothetical protein
VAGAVDGEEPGSEGRNGDPETRDPASVPEMVAVDQTARFERVAGLRADLDRIPICFIFSQDSMGSRS